MIKRLIKNQLDLLLKARLIGNKSNRIILAANHAYFEHRYLYGSLDSLEEQDFKDALHERIKYIRKAVKPFLFDRTKLDREEFNEWRASIPKRYTKTQLTDWFADTQAELIRTSIEGNHDDSRVIKAFNIGYFEHRQIQSLKSNGNLYVFQLRYGQRIDYMRSKALKHLEAVGIGCTSNNFIGERVNSFAVDASN